MVNAKGRSSAEEKLDFQEKQTVSKKVNIWVKKKVLILGKKKNKDRCKKSSVPYRTYHTWRYKCTSSVS